MVRSAPLRVFGTPPLACSTQLLCLLSLAGFAPSEVARLRASTAESTPSVNSAPFPSSRGCPTSQAPSTEGQQPQQPAEQAATAGSGAAADEGGKGGGGKGSSKGQGKGKGGKGQGAAAAAGAGTAAGGAAGAEGGAEPAWVPSKAMISKACQVGVRARV